MNIRDAILWRPEILFMFGVPQRSSETSNVVQMILLVSVE